MSKTVAFRYKLCNLRERVFLEPSLIFYIDLANIKSDQGTFTPVGAQGGGGS